MPHADLADIFSRSKSRYYINLPEVLRRVAPSLVSDILVEQSWSQEPRGLTEILEAEDVPSGLVQPPLEHADRHPAGRDQGRREGDLAASARRAETIQRNVLKMAIKAAKRVEQRYGKKNLGPWDDFEWGMINGKLSALRWALGYEWDFLDT